MNFIVLIFCILFHQSKENAPEIDDAALDAKLKDWKGPPDADVRNRKNLKRTIKRMSNVGYD